LIILAREQVFGYQVVNYKITYSDGNGQKKTRKPDYVLPVAGVETKKINIEKPYDDPQNNMSKRHPGFYKMQDIHQGNIR
jgi:hypothetical protein